MSKTVQEKYLQDLELLKKLTPIMTRLGVAEDGYYIPELGKVFIKLSVWEDKYKEYKTYRLDTLLLVLPDWCWSILSTEESICTCLMKHYPDAKIHADHLALKRLFRAIENFNSWRKYGAKEAFSKFLKACGELIILLDSEGIELKGENDE